MAVFVPDPEAFNPAVRTQLEAYRDNAAHDVQDRVDDTVTRWKNEHDDEGL